MATSLGYTRTYLSSAFKKETGMTISEYILQEKIFEAERMLTFTSKSLAEISDLFSFSSQSHFQNVFKRIAGVTPQSYRNNSK